MSSHHALMFSTPAGVLNWRMNQVISRDVQWIPQQCQRFGVVFDEGTPPRALVSTRAWRVAFKRRSDVGRGTKHELLYTIEGLEDVLQLRRILFEPGAAKTFADLTFGALLDLLQRTFAYLEYRCEIPLRRTWRTRQPRSARVFPEGRDFNLVDIAEVHAIAMELFVLRAVGDLDALWAPVDRARQGPYGTAFRIALEATKRVNDLGLSAQLSLPADDPAAKRSCIKHDAESAIYRERLAEHGKTCPDTSTDTLSATGLQRQPLCRFSR